MNRYLDKGLYSVDLFQASHIPVFWGMKKQHYAE